MEVPSVSFCTKLRIWWYFSCPRTWLYAILSWHYGFFMSTPDWRQSIFGWKLWVGGLVLYGAIGTGATNFINMVYDQVEDSVNKPVRSDYIKTVTAKQLMITTYVFYLLAILISFAYDSKWTLIFTLISIVHSHQYSAPPFRFKAHYLTNNTALSFGSCTIPFIAGWCEARPHEQALCDLPWIPLLLGFVFILLTLVAKDVPDIEGDRLAGLVTVVTPKLKKNMFYLGLYRLVCFVPTMLCSLLIFFEMLPAHYSLFTFLSIIFLAIVFTTDLGEPSLPGQCYSPSDPPSNKAARAMHFVKIFTYTQVMNCLIYAMSPSPANSTSVTGVSLPVIIFTVATITWTMIWIFTVGFLYPSAGSGVVAAPTQQGG